jgi:xanthine dehydrogenase molybdenum-binding subunit
MAELAGEAFYSMMHSEHLTAESTCQCKSNAYSFGCAFAEVEVDIPLCKVRCSTSSTCTTAGRSFNRSSRRRRVHGGMSMAIGYGLSEQLLFDEKTGKRSTATCGL